jgi:hypothetical protein
MSLGHQVRGWKIIIKLSAPLEPKSPAGCVHSAVEVPSGKMT